MISRCILCGNLLEESGEKWMLPSKGRSVPYFHCTFCDLIFLDPEFRWDEARERARYLEHNNSSEDQAYVSYLRGFAEEALLPHLGPGAKILDFGSGPVPVFARVLEELAYGVDIFDPFFAPMREWERRSYDAVTAVEVVEHFFNPLAEFRRMRRVIKPGGYLILRTLLHYSDRSRFSRWWYRQDHTHVCFYSKRSFELLAGRLDMVLIDILEGRSVVLRC